VHGDLDKMYYIILNINLLLDHWWWTYIYKIKLISIFEFFKNEVMTENWRNSGVGEMVEHWSRGNGGTLESEKW
jgi:hypothetical protein